MAPVFVNVPYCDCCGGDHRDLHLFAGEVPAHVKVWHNLPHGADSLWVLCPIFGYAVLVTPSKVKP